MTYVVDFFVFCHYSSAFGYLLGTFQYIPTVLIFGVIYWALVSKDSFFINLGIWIKFIWFIAFLIKIIIIYTVTPITIPPFTTSNGTKIDVDCGNYVPTLSNVIINFFTQDLGVKIGDSMQKSDYTNFIIYAPHLDILVTGNYLGYVITFYILWLYPIHYWYISGLFSLCFVPWSFIASGLLVNDFHLINMFIAQIAFNFLLGFMFGNIGLYLSFTYFRETYKYNLKHYICCYKNKEKQINKINNPTQIFDYNYKIHLNT